MANIILDRSYFFTLDRNNKDYLFPKFRDSLIRPMYSPKIGIVGLWAFWGLSLVQILDTLGSG